VEASRRKNGEVGERETTGRHLRIPVREQDLTQPGIGEVLHGNKHPEQDGSDMEKPDGAGIGKPEITSRGGRRNNRGPGMRSGTMLMRMSGATRAVPEDGR
jgi:hypothetical protein